MAPLAGRKNDDEELQTKTMTYSKLSVSPPSLYSVGMKKRARQRARSATIIILLLFNLSTMTPANKLKRRFGTTIAIPRYDMAVAVLVKLKTNNDSAAVRITSPSRLMICPTSRALNFLFPRTTE